MPDSTDHGGDNGLAEEELTARARILRAALRRFAADGLGAPLRRVATDAHVSAGLIIHHFGSREQLLLACDRESLAVTRREKTALVSGGAGEMLTQLAQAEKYAPVVGYVLRRLQAGGTLATELVGEFAANAFDYLEKGVEAGTISPSREPRARAEVLTEMALGGLVLQLPEQGDAMDIDDLPRWTREYTERIILPLLELYTTPMLTDSSMLDALLASRQGTEVDDDTPTGEGP